MKEMLKFNVWNGEKWRKINYVRQFKPQKGWDAKIWRCILDFFIVICFYVDDYFFYIDD